MIKYEDTYRHKGLRKKLIDLLREKGITDETVLTAMNNIPRHFFLDSAFDEIAYEDRSFPISEGQTISHPYTVAYQTQLLQIRPYDKILEIGTGSIYQATVLAEMGAKIFTIERHKLLFDKTKICHSRRVFGKRKRYKRIINADDSYETVNIEDSPIPTLPIDNTNNNKTKDSNH
jgi:protein-L-isoaspartate(D-aspartate) O-methyltransferase